MVVVDPPSQHAFENLEDSAKDGIIDELLKRGPDVFAEVAKNQWGSYCIQHSQCIAPTKRRILNIVPSLRARIREASRARPRPPSRGIAGVLHERAGLQVGHESA